MKPINRPRPDKRFLAGNLDVTWTRLSRTERLGRWLLKQSGLINEYSPLEEICPLCGLKLRDIKPEYGISMADHIEYERQQYTANSEQYEAKDGVTFI